LRRPLQLRFSPLKISKSTSPVVQLSKIFPSFFPMNPAFSPILKFILDFSFDSLRSVAHSRPMKEKLLTAVADSVATGFPVTVTLPSLAAVDAAVDFLKQRYVDVDFDGIGNGVTIFGDDQRIEGDEDDGLWILNLVIPSTALVATFRKKHGGLVTDSLSYHEPMSEALDAAHEDAHRYGWTFVSLQTVTA
jgi:hypothetical protein